MKTATTTEILTCRVGNHTFTREVKRGKKPTVCPIHKSKQVEAEAETRKKRVLTDEHKAKLLAGKAEKEAAKTARAEAARRAQSEWIKRDAKAYAAYLSGEIPREEWLKVANQIPEFA